MSFFDFPQGWGGPGGGRGNRGHGPWQGQPQQGGWGGQPQQGGWGQPPGQGAGWGQQQQGGWGQPQQPQGNWGQPPVQPPVQPAQGGGLFDDVPVAPSEPTPPIPLNQPGPAQEQVSTGFAEFAKGLLNAFGGDGFFDFNPEKRQPNPTQDIWSVQQRNPYNGTQQKYDYGYGTRPNPAPRPAPQPVPQPTIPRPAPQPVPQPAPQNNYGYYGGGGSGWGDDGGYQQRGGWAYRRNRKQHNNNFYYGFLDNYEDIFGANYRYNYKDGYDRDQSDKLDDYINKNNQKIADNFKPVDPSSNRIIPIPDNSVAPKPAINNTFISGMFGGYVPAPMREEKNDIIDRGAKPVIFNNSFIQTFKNEHDNNMLDDLQDLVAQSQSIAKARQMTGAGRFVDRDFPPDVKSIIGFGEGRMRASEYSQYPWLRPEQYFQGPYVVFNTLGPEDIEQGSLGDCYFLASIAAVAEFPERIERLILTKKVDNQSIYAIAFCHDGIWTDVVLDDTTPCQPVSKTPIFNRSAQKELWVILLEKAWAKINGGFQNIAAGLAREALRSLTGASCKTFFTQQDREDIWKNICLGDEMNFIMTGATDDLDNGSDAYQEKVGISGSHAYSLLAATEIQMVGGKWRKLKMNEKPKGPVERLVKLRNPWGKAEWKGKWRDQDPDWNDELRTELNIVNNPDDGIFCMNYNDFCKYFSDLQICYYHDGYKYSAVKLQSKSGDKVYLMFKINTAGVFYLSLNQKLTRAFPKEKQYRYSNLSFTVTKVNPDDSCKFIAAQTKDDFENWAEVKLEPGNYYVEIKTQWTSLVNEFSFSIYGPEMCPIAVTNPQEVPKNMTERAISSYAREDEDTPTLDFSKQGHPDITYKINDNKEGAGYVFFENRSPNFTLSGTADFTQSKNIVLKSPFEGLKPHFTVEPGKSVSIGFEALGFPYSFQMQLSTSFDAVQNRKEIIEQVRNSPIVMKRFDDNGNELPIFVYIMQYAEGTGVLYVNKHPEFTLTEFVQFDLNNCHIEGNNENAIEVVVRPGEEKFVNILVTDKTKDFSAEVSQISNKVHRAV